MIFLETERLILRKFREEDFSDYCEYAMDPEMGRMMGDNLSTVADTRLTFDWLMNKEERGYVLVYKPTGKVIGNLTVTSPTPFVAERQELAGKRGCALSFSISRHYRRQGLMLEAARAVIDRLFQAEGMDYINCGYFDFNIPSRELQKKLGFSYLVTDHICIEDAEITVIENILFRG